MITYKWPGFRLEFFPDTGRAWTCFPDGFTSQCGVVEDDTYHGMQLGIEPKYHRLAHELAHHLVGMRYYKETSSPVIWADAHRSEMPPAAELEEWMATALTYLAFHRPADHGALVDLQGAGCNVWAMATHLRSMVLLAMAGLTFTLDHA